MKTAILGLALVACAGIASWTALEYQKKETGKERIRMELVSTCMGLAQSYYDSHVGLSAYPPYIESLTQRLESDQEACVSGFSD